MLMNDIQVRILELLTELRDICNENDIPYTLGGRTALYAIQYGELSPVAHNASILVDAKYAKTLAGAITKKGKDGRELDYLGSNDKYPFYTMRYVNANTTCISKKPNKGFKSYGIYVEIQFIRTYIPKYFVRLKEKLIEMGLVERSKRVPSRRPKRIICRLGASIYLKFNTPEELFDHWTRLYSTEVGERVFIRRAGVRGRDFAFDYFNDKSPVILEGEEFMVVTNMKYYFRRRLGKRYATRWNRIKPPTKIVVDADMPYRYFMQYMPSEEFMKERDGLVRSLRKCNRAIAKQERVINRAWRRLNAISKSTAWDPYYEEQMEYLTELYEAGELKKLRRELKPYRRYRKVMKKADFYQVNEELELLNYNAAHPPLSELWPELFPTEEEEPGFWQKLKQKFAGAKPENQEENSEDEDDQD